jgi:myosin-5
VQDTINETGVHYVRCIKPNLNKSPEEFNVQGVNDQLRCQGILEAIRIARAAYPNRLPHYELTVRYQVRKCPKRRIFAMPSYPTNDHFTKTGSGQTQEKS